MEIVKLTEFAIQLHFISHVGKLSGDVVENLVNMAIKL